MKRNYDNKMKVATTDIEVGDKVLLKQKKTNKLSTIYGKTKYTVQEKKATGLVIQGMNGEELLRNASQIKKLKTSDRQNQCQEAINQPSLVVSSSSRQGGMQQRKPKVGAWKFYPKRSRVNRFK